VKPAHKYKIGQSVMFTSSALHLKPLGAFKIVRILPIEGGILQYRVKSVTDGHERVVLENDLT
jgi:hypothetical protein